MTRRTTRLVLGRLELGRLVRGRLVLGRLVLGPLVLGVLVSALALAGLAGLLSAAPAGLLRTLAPAQTTPVATPDHPSVVLAEVLCRVVGGALVPEGPGSDVLVGKLQVNGDVSATLQALQVGWSGPAQLAEVIVNRTSVYSGSFLSNPALVPLGTNPALVLAAGTQAELRLRFRVPGGQAWSLIQAVAFFKEGCEVALGPRPQNRCPLALGPVVPAVDLSNRVFFNITNSGTEAVEVVALDLSWPEEVNGRLAGVWVNGKLAHAFADNPPHSPASLDLRGLFDDPVPISAGQSITVGLGFEKGLAPLGYGVRLTTRRGCIVAGSDGQADPDCSIQLSGFATHDRTAILKLTNLRKSQRMLASLDVFWPAELNGPLVAVLANGAPVWTGNESRSPASLRFVGGANLSEAVLGGVPIDPGQVVELQLVFAKNDASGNGTPNAPPIATPTRAVLDGHESGTSPNAIADDNDPSTAPDAIASGDYTVVAGLLDGCTPVFSTLRGSLDAGCSVSADSLKVTPGQGEVSVNLTGSGLPATLKRLSVSWPQRNGLLTGVYFGQASLLGNPLAPQDAPQVITVTGASAATMPPNGSRPLRLTFSGHAAPNGYAVGLQFAGPAGQACDPLLVSAPGKPPECRMAFGDFKALSADAVMLDLVNKGEGQAEVRYLTLDWPADRPDAVLKKVELVYLDGSQLTVWEGEARERPARILPNGDKPPVIEAGTNAGLRLTFENLKLTANQSGDFKATISFAEGCQAAYAPEGTQVLPQKLSFAGVIKTIPGEGSNRRLIGCCWTIKTDDGDKVVETDGLTRFVPSSVTPQEGDIVNVEALVYTVGDGNRRVLAETITFRKDSAPIALIGPIDDLDQPAGNARPAWILIQGRTVTILDTTWVEGEFRLGALAQVKGLEDAKGGVTASSVKLESGGEEVFIQGTIQKAVLVDDANPLGDQFWWVDQYKVRCPANLWPPELLDHSVNALVGRQVEVHGVLKNRGGREVQANEIKMLPVSKLDKWEGELDEVPAGTLLGTWRIKFTAQPPGISDAYGEFTVESSGVVNLRRAPARKGVKVHAVIDERRSAVSVELDWPD